MDKLWIFLTFQGFSFWVCRSPAGGCPEGGSEQCGAPWGPRLTIAKLVQIISNNCIIPIYLLMVLWLEDLGSVVNGGCKQLVTGEPLNVSKKGVTIGHKNLCIYPFPQFFFLGCCEQSWVPGPTWSSSLIVPSFSWQDDPSANHRSWEIHFTIFTDVYSLYCRMKSLHGWWPHDGGQIRYI